MKFDCPVCGFSEMPYPAVPYNICPCCGTEFGVDDRHTQPAELRSTWIKAGLPWFDDITSPPHSWDPYAQLSRVQESITSYTGSISTEGYAFLDGHVVRPERARVLNSQGRIFGNLSDLCAYWRAMPAA